MPADASDPGYGTLTLNSYGHTYDEGAHAFAAFKIFCRYRSLMAEVCNSPH